MEDKEHKVSVIIPAHNAAGTIRRCLDSILSQSYECFEVIIVDNGSKDNLADIVNSYSNKRIRYFKTNRLGVSNARNMGIRKSSGEYVSFCDADDEYDYDFLKEMVNCSIINNVNIVKCAVKEVYNNREIAVEELHQLSERAMCFEHATDKEILRNIFFRADKNYVRCLTSSLLIKRKILVDNNIIFDDSVCMMEDVLFYADLFNLDEKIAFIEKPLFYYHQNPDSATHSKNNYKRIIDGAILSCSKLHERLGEDKGVDKKYLRVIFHYVYSEYFASGEIYLPDSLAKIAQRASEEKDSYLWHMIANIVKTKDKKALLMIFYLRKTKNVLNGRKKIACEGSV